MDPVKSINIRIQLPRPVRIQFQKLLDPACITFVMLNLRGHALKFHVPFEHPPGIFRRRPTKDIRRNVALRRHCQRELKGFGKYLFTLWTAKPKSER